MKLPAATPGLVWYVPGAGRRLASEGVLRGRARTSRRHGQPFFAWPLHHGWHEHFQDVALVLIVIETLEKVGGRGMTKCLSLIR
jgi:hypothetical protein